ncbi:MAG: hypothetical protein ACREMT_12250 [Vulcanimicrobiaceae bacterium]
MATTVAAAARDTYFVPDTPKDHGTRVAFRQIMQRAIATSVDDFTPLDSGKTAAPPNRYGDEFHKLNVFIPIFSRCLIEFPWHHSAMLECETKPNTDVRAVRARFDQMVSDINSLAKDPQAFLDTHGECGGGECRERVFTVALPRGELKLVLHSKPVKAPTYMYITLEAGSV